MNKDEPIACGSRKRKRTQHDDYDDDDDGHFRLPASGVLTEPPIDNEYENLDSGDDDEDEDLAGEGRPSHKIKEVEYKELFRAQEPATIDKYGDIKVTPFNLEEELEEGAFDKSGNFVFSRREASDMDKNDTWAESINWDAVSKMEQERAKNINNGASGSHTPANTIDDAQASSITTLRSSLNIMDEEPVVRDKNTCYKHMLRIMNYEETVQKTIKRLGDLIPKRQNNRQRRNNSGPIVECDQARIAETKKKLDLMIELAHNLLEDGDMDIYQKSYEDLEEAIN